MSKHGDGRGDFDFLHGRWRVDHRRLGGTGDWKQSQGTKQVRPVLGGLGAVDELSLTLWNGEHVNAATLRVFDPSANRWSLYWVDDHSCRLDPPVIGGFSNGRGEFLGDDLVDSKPVRVRIRWSDITPISAQMEQAISRDGGRSWETNLKMTLTRDD